MHTILRNKVAAAVSFFFFIFICSVQFWCVCSSRCAFFLFFSLQWICLVSIGICKLVAWVLHNSLQMVYVVDCSATFFFPREIIQSKKKIRQQERCNFSWYILVSQIDFCANYQIHLRRMSAMWWVHFRTDVSDFWHIFEWDAKKVHMRNANNNNTKWPTIAVDDKDNFSFAFFRSLIIQIWINLWRIRTKEVQFETPLFASITQTLFPRAQLQQIQHKEMRRVREKKNEPTTVHSLKSSTSLFEILVFMSVLMHSRDIIYRQK